MYRLSLKLNLFWYLSVKTFSLFIVIVLFFINLRVVAVRALYEQQTKGWMLELNMSLRKYVTLLVARQVNLKNIYRSSIVEHLKNNRVCAENFSVDLFTILSKSHSSFHLEVLEIIHIFSG